MSPRDTIAAIATAAGSAGVGIVRLSGPRARAIGEAIAGRVLAPPRSRIDAPAFSIASAWRSASSWPTRLAAWKESGVTFKIPITSARWVMS